MRSSVRTLFGMRFLFIYMLLTVVVGVTIADGQYSKPTVKPSKSAISGMVILSKPNAGYTEAARINRTEGVVRVLVVFKATGEIGDVSVLTALPHGLTERAVEAARLIKFSPKSLNGTPMDEQTTVDYNFRLYYDNDDDDIGTKIEILSMPKPSLSRIDVPDSLEGKVSVKVFFSSRGNSSVFELPPGLSSSARSKVEDAVKRIKFRPAVHVNGNRMSVTRVVQYDL